MKFNIVSHTHWDREWHKTFEEYRVRLVSFFDNLIDLLERDSNYRSFLMDGQTVVLEDYLEIKPFKKKQLHQLIKNGRIIVGPWYIQPDEFIPSGEMQIRNLLIGQAIGEEFGNNMQVGYLPDSFGQSAQIPQLLQGFDIEYAVFWRGMTEAECEDLDFYWESPDGSKVKTTILADGYGNASLLNESLENNISIIEENINSLYSRSNKRNLLLMSGFDQRKANPILPKIVSDLNEHFDEHEFTISTISDYLEEAFRMSDKKTVSGEFRKGKYMRVHISIGLTRSDIKQENYKAQVSLIKFAEPLMSFASLFGLDYQNELLNQAAKYTLQNQAHDSISNVCTDSTHREISLRYENTMQISKILMQDSLETISNNIQTLELGEPVILFNLGCTKRQGFEKISLVTGLPVFDLVNVQGEKVDFDIISKKMINKNDMQIEIGMKNKDVQLYQYELMVNVLFTGFGYKTFYLTEKEREKNENPALFDKETSVFSTDYFTLRVEENGTLTYTDRESGEVYSNLNQFVENGNAGDEYDYSAPINDQIFSAHTDKPAIQVIHNSDSSSIIKLTYHFDVPKETYASSRSSMMISQKIESTITVTKDSKRIDFKTTIDNQAKNHRICVQFANNQLQDSHFSEQQFGPITRMNKFKNTNQWKEEKWEERYYPIYPQQRYTGFSNRKEAMLILNKGLVTYEILDDEGVPTIAIPLITTMDFMGKQDLLDRPGRRSGLHIPTPDSEMIGTYEYEYAILFSNDNNFASLADDYQLPITTIQKKNAEGSLPGELVLYSLENKNVSIMSFKKSEDKVGYIIRLVNHDQASTENVTLTLNSIYFKKIEEVNFKESVKKGSEKFVFQNGVVTIPRMKANEVISFRLEGSI